LGEEDEDGEFTSFESLPYGVRAGDRTLNTYGLKYGIDTIRDAITRWAPPNENDTEGYIEFVSRETGIPSEAPIDLEDPRTRSKLLSAMARLESNMELSEQDILDMVSRVDESEVEGGSASLVNSPTERETAPDASSWRSNLPENGLFQNMRSGITQGLDILDPALESLGELTESGADMAKRYGSRFLNWAAEEVKENPLDAISYGLMAIPLGGWGYGLAAKGLSKMPSLLRLGRSMLGQPVTYGGLGLGLQAYDMLGGDDEEEDVGLPPRLIRRPDLIEAGQPSESLATLPSVEEMARRAQQQAGLASLPDAQAAQTTEQPKTQLDRLIEEQIATMNEEPSKLRQLADMFTAIGASRGTDVASALTYGGMNIRAMDQAKAAQQQKQRQDLMDMLSRREIVQEQMRPRGDFAFEMFAALSENRGKDIAEVYRKYAQIKGTEELRDKLYQDAIRQLNDDPMYTRATPEEQRQMLQQRIARINDAVGTQSAIDYLDPASGLTMPN
jgi:hypothetical protein